MNIRLGEKIKELRKSKNISQDTLAQYLGVSFQAVSKWESGITLPDVALIPAIAAFFDVSIDTLFQYNRLEAERLVSDICEKAYALRRNDPQKAEEVLREGLRKFPANEILLNNLLYTMRSPARSKEVIDICITLAESSKNDDVRFDALRILAETYHESGQQDLVKPTLEKIPEIYFTKLELMAKLLESSDSLNAAESQMIVSLNHLIEMLLIAEKQSEVCCAEKPASYRDIALNVLSAFYKWNPDFFNADFFGDNVKTLLQEIK